MGYQRVQRDWLKKANHAIMGKGGAFRSKKAYSRKQKHREDYLNG